MAQGVGVSSISWGASQTTTTTDQSRTKYTLAARTACRSPCLLAVGALANMADMATSAINGCADEALILEVERYPGLWNTRSRLNYRDLAKRTNSWNAIAIAVGEYRFVLLLKCSCCMRASPLISELKLLPQVNSWYRFSFSCFTERYGPGFEIHTSRVKGRKGCETTWVILGVSLTRFQVMDGTNQKVPVLGFHPPG